MQMQGMGTLELEIKGVVPSCLDDEEQEELESGSGSGSEDLGTIEEAVEVLLTGLGEDCMREGLRKTPLRVAKAFRDGTRGYKQKVNDIVQGALFPEAGLNTGKGLAGGAGGLVVVRDINLFSYCESCLLPFRVQCQVGYIPSGQRVIGLSKLARVADVFAKRLQSPQRLAEEVCSALQNSIQPAGVAVALQCWHIQFPEPSKSTFNLKNASKLDTQDWVQVHTRSTSGVFKDKSSNFLDDFVALLKFRGVKVENNVSENSCLQSWYPETHSSNGHGTVKPMNGKTIQSWCPLLSLVIPSCNAYGTMSSATGSLAFKNGTLEPAMIGAVTSILHSIGEDPLRKELVATPHRFLHWLMCFKRATSDIKLNGLNYGSLGLATNGQNHDNQEEIRPELSLPFCAQCEHHLLPFHGVVHIGYVFTKENQPVERSMLQSIVQFYGRMLQVQERLTRQIAETVFSTFSRGVMVVVEANHICMISRGVKKLGSNTATVATMGLFSTDSAAKATFLQSILESTAYGK